MGSEMCIRDRSDAVVAFQDDLDLLGISDRVIGMTYSEFGRRIRSNAALGTDHGNAAPLFVFGNCVNNQILGDTPVIDTHVDDYEGVAMQFDFRDIYKTIITDWLGGSQSDANSVLFQQFDGISLFDANCSASLSNNNFENEDFGLNIYPNPASNMITINFVGFDGNVKITIFNSIGAVVKSVTNKSYDSNNHSLQVDISNFARGNYFVHYQTRGISKTKKLIKY